eukprot:jgi/Chrzof1/1611/Cz10g14160.t1
MQQCATGTTHDSKLLDSVESSGVDMLATADAEKGGTAGAGVVAAELSQSHHNHAKVADVQTVERWLADHQAAGADTLQRTASSLASQPGTTFKTSDDLIRAACCGDEPSPTVLMNTKVQGPAREPVDSTDSTSSAEIFVCHGPAELVDEKLKLIKEELQWSLHAMRSRKAHLTRLQGQAVSSRGLDTCIPA